MTRSDFTKNVLTLISGTTVAQVISIGISPILARMYTEVDFGLFASFSALVGFVSLLVGARYEGAILLPKKNEDAINLLALSLILNIFISVLFLIGVFGFVSIQYPNQEVELLNWYYLAPVFTMFTGFAQSINNWYNRKKQYKKIVYYRVSNSVLNSGGALTFGLSKTGPNGMILALIMSSIVSISLFLIDIKNDIIEFRSAISLTRMKQLAIDYKRFPLTNSIQSLSDAFQVYGIVCFIDYFFGKLILGVYSLSFRVLQMPMNFVGGAISQVFYQQASDTYNEGGDLQSLVRSTIKKSVLIAIPILVILLFFGPQLFAFVFGTKWYNAGVYAQLLSPWILLDFVRAPLSQIPIIIGRQNKLLMISMLNNSIIVVSMLYAGIVLKDIKMGLIILSVLQSVYVIAIITWIYRISNIKNKNILHL